MSCNLDLQSSTSTDIESSEMLKKVGMNINTCYMHNTDQGLVEHPQVADRH